MKWGDAYSRLEQQMLMPFPLNRSDKSKSEKKYKYKDSQRGKTESELRTVYCADYQKGSCKYDESHQGLFFGKSTMLYHICGVCWKEDEKKSFHPSSASECPHSDM